ncbi:MAG: hypothetical protein JWR67_2372 [Mucilaginibacter sp.]|jgi:hypothetical protein|nr:hypothetical protein [Mucilaginibacter sp.]MDB5111258.1 hypothetical protein [Mucilaginibacter sp.]
MENSAFVKSQQVITPAGVGEIIEIIGDKVKVKIESGEIKVFKEEEIEDNSSAG